MSETRLMLYVGRKVKDYDKVRFRTICRKLHCCGEVIATHDEHNMLLLRILYLPTTDDRELQGRNIISKTKCDLPLRLTASRLRRFMAYPKCEIYNRREKGFDVIIKDLNTRNVASIMFAEGIVQYDETKEERVETSNNEYR